MTDDPDKNDPKRALRQRPGHALRVPYSIPWDKDHEEFCRLSMAEQIARNKELMERVYGPKRP